MQQIFVSQNLADVKNLTVSGEDYQHLIKALRLKENDKFWIVDQMQQTFSAQIIQIQAKDFIAQLTKVERQPTELPVRVVVGCSLSKKDKIELIAQKATELGAHELIFFESRYSIMKWKSDLRSKKLARLQQIVTSAAQQSHRLQIPKVRYLTFNDLLQMEVDYRLVAYEEDAKVGEHHQLKTVFTKLQPQQSLLCLFGPEGGFHIEEIEQLRQNNYISCSLGPRILRAETAPLYFLSSLSYQIELSKGS